MKERIIIAIALLAIVGGASVTLVSSSSAATATKWKCYYVDKLSDVKKAADHKKAKTFTKAMNSVAPRPKAGGTVVLTSSGKDYLCAKK